MRKRKNKLIVWLAIAVFVIAFIGFGLALLNYSSYWFGLERRNFYTNVNITADTGGFDLNTTALTFGKIKIGGSATRNIIFENNYDFPVIVKINSEGSINQLLSYEKEVFVDEEETKKIGFSVTSKASDLLGYYDGFIEFKIIPAK